LSQIIYRNPRVKHRFTRPGLACISDLAHQASEAAFFSATQSCYAGSGCRLHSTSSTRWLCQHARLNVQTMLMPA